MRDSRVGAIGIQVLILVIFFQIACLLKLGNSSIVALPIATFWGRVSPLWAIEKFQYLHDQGLGSTHKTYWKGYKNEIIPSILVLCLISLFLILNPLQIDNLIRIIFLIWLGIIPAIIIPNCLGEKLGGHSGDSYGASVVLVETFILLSLSLIL